MASRNCMLRRNMIETSVATLNGNRGTTAHSPQSVAWRMPSSPSATSGWYPRLSEAAPTRENADKLVDAPIGGAGPNAGDG